MLLTAKARSKKNRISENQLSLFDLFSDSTEFVVKDVIHQTESVEEKTLTLNKQDETLHESEKVEVLEVEAVDVIEVVEEVSVELRSIPKQITTPKNFSYTLVLDEIYYHENSEFIKYPYMGRRAQRLKGMIELHEMVREILAVQAEEVRGEYTEAEFNAHFKTLLEGLNTRYDAFVKAFGYLNSKTNTQVFSDDSGAPLLQSIEVESKTEKEAYEKGVFFFKPTLQRFKAPTVAESPDEALKLSLNLKGKVDLDFMCELYSAYKGEVVSLDEMTQALGHQLYLNPEKLKQGLPRSQCYETADEYLSGFVKEKLHQAKEAVVFNPNFTRNVEALELAQPTPLKADEISFILGSTWIPIEYYQAFIFQLLDVTHPYYRQRIKIEFSKLTSEYQLTGKTELNHTTLANQTYGTRRISALRIFEDSLNLKTVEVKDRVLVYNKEGQQVERYVLNQQETLLAREKQALIKAEFENWLFEDSERAEALVSIYNETFNTIRPRQFDGNHLLLPGMTPDIKLEEHQRNVICHGLFGSGNLLIAQEVGAGKTYSAIAIGHEMKRLGLVSKPLYAVPNHLVGQWAREYLTLYPSANILVATKKDLEKKHRQRFLGRIATSDHDAIIMPQSSFDLINLSPAYQIKTLKAELEEIKGMMDQLVSSGEGYSFSHRQIGSMKNKIEEQIEKLEDEMKKQTDQLYFEDLGVDCLIVDEAHAYKNHATHTKLRNIAGISNTRSQRAAEMYMKVQYINEKMNGRGVIYLTGTPVSNSMSELHVIQKTLQPKILKERGLLPFDCWASMFGRIESSLEIKPEGNGYQLKQRFARFHNLPELMSIFSLIADIKTSDMLNLPTPDLKDGKPIVIKTEITAAQQAIVEEHGLRAEAIRAGEVDSSEDNFLKLTMEARLNAIDPRILDESLVDDKRTKLNVCAAKVAEIYHETADRQLTQIVFCDQGTPKSEGFNFYDAMKAELIRLQVKAEEIAFIHEAKTDVQRLALFEKVIKGEVRVLMGSTAKMGTGVNVQDKLIAVHHLDIPWRPADLTQRNGRILRRGNENQEVMIFNYITEDTFDSYLWQILEQKQRYISQIMTGRSQLRTCEDLDDTTLQYAEFKALAVKDTRIKRKMEVDNELNRLTLLKSMWKREQSQLVEKIQTTLPTKIQQINQTIDCLEKDLAVYQEATEAGIFNVEIDGQHYSIREEANQAMRLLLAKMNTHLPYGEYRRLGSYENFEFGLVCQSLMAGTELCLKGAGLHRTRFVATRVLAQLDALMRGFEGSLENAHFRLAETEKELASAQEQVNQPFAYAEQLKEIQLEKSKLDLELEFEQIQA